MIDLITLCILTLFGSESRDAKHRFCPGPIWSKMTVTIFAWLVLSCIMQRSSDTHLMWIRDCFIYLILFFIICSEFLSARRISGLDEELGEWEIRTIPHTMQSDGSSCGIYVLKVSNSFKIVWLCFGFFTNWDCIIHAKKKVK